MSLAFAGALVLAGCSGSKGDAGAPGAGGATGPTGPTGPGGNPGVSSASTGLHVNVVSVSTTSPITVRFTLKDDRGFPVDIAGVYSVNTDFSLSGTNSQLRFALAYTTEVPDPNSTGTLVQPYTVLTNSGTPAQPTVFSPWTAGQGTIAENGWGAGDYTYTFPATVSYDATKLSNSHVVWILATRQTNLNNVDDPKGFTAVDQDYWFVPAGGTPVKREIVKTSNCSNCHRGFKPGEGSIAASTFHGGARNEATFCDICHNPGRTNAAAEAKVFVHRIHNGEHLQPANLFHGLAATYPQDIRNCNACHGSAAQGDQYKRNPTIAACGSCHDYVSFTGANAQTCTDPVTVDANGLPVPCNHIGGVKADGTCSGCHGPTDIDGYHVTVVPPDPTSTRAGGANNYTNAAFVAAANAVPAGAIKVTYEVASVDAVPVAGGFQPSITFRFLFDGAAQPMQTYAAGVTTEIFQNFVGSPSVYFAFSVPQDGVAAPADFNATVSGYIKNIWNGTATGTAVGTITGPDANQWYTIQLTGVVIPTTATMLTGGIGYDYALTTTPPLTQTNVPGYPYNVAVPGYPYVTAGSLQGGLIVPAPDVVKVANGYTGRRPIVDTARCQTCHVALGVAPNFHAGQRNDGTSCSFCHTPNRTSSGWSASAKSFIHAIHGARKRTEPFTWHASASGSFADVEFPGPLNNCTACHVDGGFGFSAAAKTVTSGTSTIGTQGTTVCTVAAPCTCTTRAPCVTTGSGANALSSLLPSTVGQGTYTIPAPPAVNTISPYVDGTGATNYGTGFTYTASSGATAEAAGTTLVISPIAAACVACHDSPITIDHMQANGGKFYQDRATALAAAAPLEQCMLCHGKNSIADIAVMHQ